MSKPVLLGIGFDSLSPIIRRHVESHYEYDDFDGTIKGLEQRCADENIVALLIEYGPYISLSIEHLAQYRQGLPTVPIVVATYYSLTIETIIGQACAPLLINSENPTWREQLIEKITEAQHLISRTVA